jgi:hypothetical protein
MSEHPISEFERELIRATIRACGVNPPESQDYDAIVAEAIERTKDDGGCPFTLIAYRPGDCDDGSYFDAFLFSGLSEAIAAIAREVNNDTDTDNLLLFHGQALDLSDYHAEQAAAIAAERARRERAYRERRAQEQRMRAAEKERLERNTLAALKAKYEKPA